MNLSYILVVPKPLERLHLSQLLKKIDGLTLKAEFSNAIDALNYLNYNSIDFIFLASDLPVYSGFEFLKKVKDPIEVILLTNDAKDALEAYSMNILDCIAPPLSLKRLNLSVNKIKDKKQFQFLVADEKHKFVVVKSNLKTEKILLSSIFWIEAMGDYVKIITQEKKYLVLSTMKDFLQKLPQNQFVRIHKSYIINLNKVLHHTSNSVNILGQSLPLSRNHKKYFQTTYSNI
ncbi:MAG: LytTR family DNA-binding domain-containing protein [Flavobacteriaceae bacterium]|jgi:DNA-binding LytR/AlgR family response regulator